MVMVAMVVVVLIVMTILVTVIVVVSGSVVLIVMVMFFRMGGSHASLQQREVWPCGCGQRCWPRLQKLTWWADELPRKLQHPVFVLSRPVSGTRPGSARRGPFGRQSWSASPQL